METILNKESRAAIELMVADGVIAKDTAERYFPELKESEGEKTWIINYLSNRILNSTIIAEKENLKKAVAWLEKQGEHAKFCDSIQVGDKVTRNQDGMLVNLSQLERVAKPVEEYNITGIGSKHAQGKLGEMIKNLKSAWSEEDERMIDTIIYDLERHGGKEDSCYSAEINWLNSLKNRVQPQPKQEWSEDDGKMIKFFQIALGLINNCEFPINGISREESVHWLKSLRPQNTWKPSEEQMNALDDVISSRDIKYDVLSELWKYLKKLREE